MPNADSFTGENFDKPSNCPVRLRYAGYLVFKQTQIFGFVWKQGARSPGFLKDSKVLFIPWKRYLDLNFEQSHLSVFEPSDRLLDISCRLSWLIWLTVPITIWIEILREKGLDPPKTMPQSYFLTRYGCIHRVMSLKLYLWHSALYKTLYTQKAVRSCTYPSKHPLTY